MVNSMIKKYDQLKRFGISSLNYDEILLYYPDYFKTKVELEHKFFSSKIESDQEFENNYKNSDLYKELLYDTPEEEAYKLVKGNMDLKYKCLKLVFESAKKDAIKLCELIDYIGHYPTTYPVPKEEEKDPQMEELLEKYDIMIRYIMHDNIDCMQITSDDIVRIIEKLNKDLNCIKLIENELNTTEWMFTKTLTNEARIKYTEEIIEELDSFPLSEYQKLGKSNREEGKIHLRLQFGKNII